MSFEWPLLLLSVLLVPGFVGLYLYAQRRRMRYALRFTNIPVLAGVASGARQWRRYVPVALFLVALAAVCVGMGRPHVTVTKPDERATILLVVDTSRSMQETDVKPTRLIAAKRAARLFVGEIPRRLRVGVLTFAGDVSVNVPPTADHGVVRSGVDSITTFQGTGGGTAIGDALARAVEVGRESVRTRQGDVEDTVAVVFLSDGRQFRGILLPEVGAQRAKEAGIEVHTVSLGTPGGPGGPSPPTGFQTFRAPDPATLRMIARVTGGEFFETRSAKAVEAAYRDLGSRLGRKRERDEVTYAFLAGAAAILVAAGVCSARWGARLP